MQNHTEATLQEGMVQSLHRAAADLVQYLGLQALVSEIINVRTGVRHCGIL